MEGRGLEESSYLSITPKRKKGIR